jgi:hypothetical protein
MTRLAKNDIVIYKIKVKDKNYRIVKGKWWDFFFGMLCIIFSTGITMLIMDATGYRNIIFFKVFVFIFACVLLFKFSPLWYRATMVWREK